MAKVLLGVTGSVAAILTPDLYRRLREAGHHVKVVATTAALYFFDPAALDPSQAGRNPEVVVLDEDEWPGQGSGRRYQRGDPVLHIELRRWAEALVVAPLDANTLAKLAGGLCDNCLTCVWRAWERSRPVVVAPAIKWLQRGFKESGDTMWKVGCNLLNTVKDYSLAVPSAMPGTAPNMSVSPWGARGKKKETPAFAEASFTSGRLDSNQRPPEPHSGALAKLRHAPQ
jgi:hypothetical protein